jgi:hypothetical protein
MTKFYEWKLTALADIWTGDADGNPEHLITTGLLGSIRWWYEVLVRGFGGPACDPTKTSCVNEDHCAVCELFGCTGWGRKFRFDVLKDGGGIQRDQIKIGEHFRLRFTPLRPISTEELALIDLTLRLIADYGAIGGKTVYKPSKGLYEHTRRYPPAEQRCHPLGSVVCSSSLVQIGRSRSGPRLLYKLDGSQSEYEVARPHRSPRRGTLPVPCGSGSSMRFSTKSAVLLRSIWS